jgi:hypothetical protein
MKQRIAKIAITVVLLYGLATSAMYGVMLLGPEPFANTMKHLPWQTMMILPFKPLWMSARAGRVVAGDFAPDFDLKSADGNSAYHLEAMRGARPVVLVFGSYT